MWNTNTAWGNSQSVACGSNSNIAICNAMFLPFNLQEKKFEHAVLNQHPEIPPMHHENTPRQNKGTQ
jgi:hypothetical protein